MLGLLIKVVFGFGQRGWAWSRGCHIIVGPVFEKVGTWDDGVAGDHGGGVVVTELLLRRQFWSERR